MVAVSKTASQTAALTPKWRAIDRPEICAGIDVDVDHGRRRNGRSGRRRRRMPAGSCRSGPGSRSRPCSAWLATPSEASESVIFCQVLAGKRGERDGRLGGPFRAPGPGGTGRRVRPAVNPEDQVDVARSVERVVVQIERLPRGGGDAHRCGPHGPA